MPALERPGELTTGRERSSMSRTADEQAIRVLTEGSVVSTISDSEQQSSALQGRGFCSLEIWLQRGHKAAVNAIGELGARDDRR
jgi:hypothetical protein